MVTIAASRVWALSTLRRLLWTSHAPIAGGWPSRDQAASVGAISPETDDPGMGWLHFGRWWTHHSLPRRRAGWRILCFFFFRQNLDKRAVSSISGSPQGTGGCERVNLESHSPSSLASEQLWAVREGSQSLLNLNHYSRTLCRNAHADPASDRQRDARAGSLRSPSLPHRGYVCGFVGATSTVLGGLASASQPVSLAPPYHQTRLCDSVRPATSQVSRRPLYLSEGSGCPHLASRDRIPTGEGRDRAGPSSRYEVRVLQPLLHCTQERRWVKTNLGSAHLEPGPSQAHVQNAHTETHLWVRPSPRLVCSDRPEGRVLPRVDPSAPQVISVVCVRRTGISVQSPALRAVPVTPCPLY